MSHYPIPPLNQNSAIWLALHRLTPPEKDYYYWQLIVSMSTVPLSDYIARKSRIKPGDLRLTLDVSCVNGWHVLLSSTDNELKVIWQPNTAPAVWAGSFIHRHKKKWPVMAGIDDFRPLVAALESLLNVRFHRKVGISAASIQSEQIETLRQWTAPLCDVLELWAARLYGEAPDKLPLNDAREKGAGIQFTLIQP